jgi:MFS superfamily sulfate permease-like transporter
MADLKGSSVGAWWVPRYRLSWLRPDLIGYAIAIGQLKSLVGVSRLKGDRVVEQLWSAITSIPEANAAALIMSIGCIAALLAAKRWLRRVPGSLIVVLLAILVTWLGDGAGISLHPRWA